MFFNEDCMKRNGKSAPEDCLDCSEVFVLNLNSMDEISIISDLLVLKMMQSECWQPHGAEVAFILGYTVTRTSINAIEHGILDLSRNDKKELKAKLKEEYEDYIIDKWQEKGLPVAIKLCVNEKRVLLGINGASGELSFNDEGFTSLPESELQEPADGGIDVLRSFGHSLYRNEKGNAIICHFKRPDTCSTC